MTFRATGKIDLIRKVLRIELLVAAFVRHILLIKRRSIQNRIFPRNPEMIARNSSDSFNENLAAIPGR